MKTHWHLGYSNKMACGRLAYKTEWEGEYDSPSCERLLAAIRGRSQDVSCKGCQKVMMLGAFAVPETGDPHASK